MRKLLSLLLLFPCLAFGRMVVVATNMDSIWSVQTWIGVTLTGSASLLDSSDNVISTAPAGTIGTVSNITATFPTVKAAVTVAKIKLILTQQGNGWTGTWVPTYAFPTPLPLAVGETPTFVYNPTAGLLGASLTANITSTVVAPPPPVTVVTTVGGGPIVDLVKATWTLGPKNPAIEGGIQFVILRNGTQNGAASEICLSGNRIYVMNQPGAVWYIWTDNSSLARGGSFAQATNPGC